MIGGDLDLESVQRLFADLCRRLALPPVPLVVRRGAVTSRASSPAASTCAATASPCASS
ncbi:MAG: hypothetical protein R3F43_07735 [bacterium]